MMFRKHILLLDNECATEQTKLLRQFATTQRRRLYEYDHFTQDEYFKLLDIYETDAGRDGKDLDTAWTDIHQLERIDHLFDVCNAQSDLLLYAKDGVEANEALANEAQSTADQAKLDAAAAQTTAEEAKAAADLAQQAADDALAIGAGAEAAAAEAQAAADLAQANAVNAEIEAQLAKDTAVSAQDAADLAQIDATKALELAADAQVVAGNAQADASVALSQINLLFGDVTGLVAEMGENETFDEFINREIQKAYDAAEQNGHDISALKAEHEQRLIDLDADVEALQEADKELFATIHDVMVEMGKLATEEDLEKVRDDLVDVQINDEGQNAKIDALQTGDQAQNDAIDALTQSNNELANDVGDLQGDFSDLTNDIENVESILSEQGNAIDETTAAATQNAEDIDELKELTEAQSGKLDEGFAEVGQDLENMETALGADITAGDQSTLMLSDTNDEHIMELLNLHVSHLDSAVTSVENDLSKEYESLQDDFEDELEDINEDFEKQVSSLEDGFEHEIGDLEAENAKILDELAELKSGDATTDLEGVDMNQEVNIDLDLGDMAKKDGAFEMMEIFSGMEWWHFLFIGLGAAIIALASVVCKGRQSDVDDRNIIPLYM